jgi:CBS domain containing-hemolysin-like protein
VYIQKSEKISDILKILQSNKSHMAVVIDEYGGTLGIVTMEDILEELVGEIWDEHDEIIEEYRLVDENTYIVDASENFEDFCQFFDIEAEADSVSVGGWVMEQLGKIAQVGDSFTYQDMTVTVTETDHPRVTQILVVKQTGEDRVAAEARETKG